MGRHGANRPGPDYGGSRPARSPLHADLFSQRDRRADADPADALIATHYESLRGYVLELTEGDESATADVLKETFYRAERDRARHQQLDSAVRPWLVLIAQAVVRDGERHAPAGHDDRPESVRRRPSGGSLPPVTVIRAVEELPAEQREVLVELFYRGVSLEEAARIRDISVDTVKTRLYYAMHTLSAVLDRQIAERYEA
jgi:RNA polymerase sigma-70 factor (ECF subfamily)